MTNPKQPHPSEDAGDVLRSGLAPSQCGSCFWGRVVRCVRPLDLIDISELPEGSPIKGESREMSFCKCPDAVGYSDEAEPFHFEYPVEDCEMYLGRLKAEEVMKAEEAARRKRDRLRRARGARGGRRRR